MLNLLECSPIAKFVVGPDHKITHWNRACEILTGFSAAEMVGTDRQWEPFYPDKRPVLADLILDNDYQGFLDLYKGRQPERSKVVPNAWEATGFFGNLNGKDRYIYFLAAPIVDSSGKITGACETLQDVTDQKQRLLSMERESENLRQINQLLRISAKERYRLGDIIGKSPAMQEVYDLIIKAAATNLHVIVSGESGTGKELVARAIHDMSDRQGHEYVPVNCGAIPVNLLESEFFGYKKGAFSGAHRDHTGYLDLADKGTLFLDEVGELSLALQVKLLRVLEGSGYSPVGSSQFKKSDIRVIVATNRKPMDLVKMGVLREDFFYRVHIIPITLPPLRERKEDILLLVDHFLSQYGKRDLNSRIPAEVIDVLCSHNWPGNIRELHNVLHRYVTLNKLDINNSLFTLRSDNLPSADPAGVADDSCPLHDAVADFEKDFILKALERNKWNRSNVAKFMGISRKTLFRKMKQHNIS